MPIQLRFCDPSRMFPSGGYSRVLVQALAFLFTIAAASQAAAAADVVALRVSPASETMSVGDTRQYHATAIYDDGSSADVTATATWASSLASVASVDSAGIVTAFVIGDTAVTATFAGVTGAATTLVRGVDAFVYASGWGAPSGPRGFHADLISGQLTSDLGAWAAGLAPWGTAADPSGRFLYVTNRDDNTVSAFAIDATTGTLTLRGHYPTAGQWPVPALVEPSGRFLYVGNTQGNSIAGYAIGADGSLTAVPGSPFAVQGVTAMTVHPTGAFLYFSTNQDHRIAAHRINADGSITPVPGSPFWFDAFGHVNNLLGLTADRSGRFVLASDNSTHSIRVFSVDPASGALTGEAFRHNDLTLSRGILAHPNGRHVIAAGFDGINVFTLDAVTGAITAVAGSPFASNLNPQVLALDHSGSRLYGVNGDQTGSTIESFSRISLHYFDPATGAVTRFGEHNAGATLFGVVVVPSNGPSPDLTSIDITPDAATLLTVAFGGTQAFTATGAYSDGRSGPLTGVAWSSSDPNVATIDPVSGIAVTTGYGTTTITASRSGQSRSTTLTVSAATLTGLFVTPAAAIVEPGGTRPFFATAVYSDGNSLDATATATWSSSATTVASVTGGVVTAVGPGVTTISASLGGFSATASLTVSSSRVLSYVVDRTGAQLFAYTRANGAGTLTPVAGTPFAPAGTGPETVALHPSGRLLFAADAINDRLYAFQVDGQSGHLIAAPGSPFATRRSPAHLAIDPHGRFIYVLHRSDQRLSAFAIDQASGQLTPIANSDQLPGSPRSLTIEPGGRFLYAGAGQGDGLDTIRAYAIDQATGALTPAGDVPTGRFPEALISDPSGRMLYAANGADNAVRRYAINTSTGALTAVGSTPTGLFPYRLAFHPTGQVLYVGVRTNSTLTSFAVTPGTGALTAVNTVPVFGGINAAAIEPNGEYLYITGEDLTVYAVDAAGALSQADAHDAGTLPVSVTVAGMAPGGSVTLTSLAITPASATVQGSTPGGTTQFVATGHYSDGSTAFLTHSVTWSSSDPGAASISATGLATALAVPATVTITASLGPQTATATFIASNAPSRVVVAPVVETIGIGSERTFRTTAIYPGDIAEDVSGQAAWTSSDPAIATVDGNGVVRALAHGDVTITAGYLGVHGEARVQVRGVDAYLYTSSWGAPNGVRGDQVDLINGQLTASSGVAASGNAPWGVAIDPTGRWLYVANRESDTVSAFAIGAGGALTLLDTYPSGGDAPFSAVVEPRGRFLYVGNLQGASIAGFAINADGTLTSVPGSPIAVPGVLAMAAHPGGEYLYFSTSLDHRIAAYRIGSTGALTPVAGSPYWFDDFGAFNNLLGIAVHRSGRFLLASDNSTSSIRVFSLDAGSGALTGEAFRLNGLSLSRAILAHPDGQHVIAAGFNGINVFTFDEATGALTAVPGSPFASGFQPQALALDYTGTKLYGVMGDQSGPSVEAFFTISAHSFDPVSGAVVRIGTTNTGGLLTAVAITASNTPGPTLNAIAVTPANLTHETTVFGITRTFTASGVFSDGRSGVIDGATWQSSDPSVASIDSATGITTLHAYGTTTITATRGGISGHTSFTVAPAPVVALFVTPVALQVIPGAAPRFNATAHYADGIDVDVTAVAAWSSSAPAITSVMGGLATAHAAGIATITTTFGGYSAAAQITVKAGTVAAYSANRAGGEIFGYLRSAAALSPIDGSPFSGGGTNPEAVALDPAGQFLFAADSPNDRLHVFQVDGVSGRLLPAPGSPFTTRRSPFALATDPSGRFLYVAHQGTARLSAFAIDRTSGSLTAATVDQDLPWPARSIAVDRSGRFVFAGTARGDGSDRIHVFTIDQGTGALTKVSDVATGRFATALATDPSGRHLYVANGGDNLVSRYAINLGSGALTPAGTTPTNPFPSTLTFHPGGQVLYVGNSTASALTSFAVAPVTGALSAITSVPVFGGIRAAVVEPAGDYLYVLGEMLGLYAVDAAGALTKIQDYASGVNPSSVTAGMLAPAPGSSALTTLTVTPGDATAFGSLPGGAKQFTAIGNFADGSSAFLTASATWTSSSPSVSVSSTGLATALAVPASATITATFGILTATATFTASKTPTRIVVAPSSDTLAAGQTRSYRATAIYADGSGEDVSSATAWSSSSVAVASIDGLGALTGVAPGDATITAQYLGASGSAVVRVRGLEAYLYASGWALPNGLRGYRVDLTTGHFAADLGTTASGIGPWGVAIDPAGRWAYVANREEDTVSAYAISGSTGTLTPIGTYPTDGDFPYSAIVDPSGRFLYVGNLQGPSVAAYAIGPDGSLTPVPGSPFGVPGVVAMAMHPSGEHLYFSTGLDHRIAAYRIGSDGSLTAAPGSPYWFDEFGQFNNLLGITVHRSGRYVIASDNSTSSIRVFRVDAATGALTGEAFRLDNVLLSKGIVAHPDGIHVIAAGRDGAGIHVFTIDLATGALTPVPGSPFSSNLNPQELVLDHTGTRLYGVNGDQSAATFAAMSTISLHTFDPASGVVTRITTRNTFASLMGVAITAAAPADTTPPPAPVITSGPADPSAPSTGVFRFTFSNAEPGVQFECAIDSSAYTPCVSPHEYFGSLNAGAHAFEVRAFDDAGNRSAPARFTWVVDAPYTLIFSVPASMTIVYGTPSVSVSGSIAAGARVPPAGEFVTIVVNGVLVSATLDGSGRFTATLDTRTFGAQPSNPYAIHFAYAGNPDFAPAFANTALTVTPATAAITVTGFTGVYDGVPHGATGSATGVNGTNLNAFLNLGATFTNPPGGTATWSFAGNTNYVPASGSVAIVITAAPPTGSPDGRMFGAGHVDAGNRHHHFVFRVRQWRNKDYGRFEYWFNDTKGCRNDDDHDDGDDDRHYGRDRHGNRGRFEATSIDSVEFLDDPAFTPGKGRKPPTVDSVTFSGRGKWNGKSGYTFEVRASDRGEPGRHRDTFRLVVKDQRGAIVASVDDTLDGGNVQSIRLKR